MCRIYNITIRPPPVVAMHLKTRILNSSIALLSGCIMRFAQRHFLLVVLLLTFPVILLSWSMNRIAVSGSLFLATLFLNTRVASAVFNTANEIPSSFFKEEKEISVQVVKVIDGDTYRVRHLPFFWSNADFKGNLADKTISVRIAAVDCPETAKFGSKGQKYGPVATKFVAGRILGKKVTVKLLARDQYSRAIGSVTYYEGPFKRDIAEELMKNGLAVVYRQKGGRYPNGGIAFWNKLEDKAKSSKTGLWSEKNVELPSDYKKQAKEVASMKKK